MGWEELVRWPERLPGRSESKNCRNQGNEQERREWHRPLRVQRPGAGDPGIDAVGDQMQHDTSRILKVAQRVLSPHSAGAR